MLPINKALIDALEQALRWKMTLRFLGWTPEEIDRLFGACAQRAQTTARSVVDCVEDAIWRAKLGEPDLYGIKARQP